MKYKLLLCLFFAHFSYGQNQLEDSLIALTERMPDTSFTASYRWDNYKYQFNVTNKPNSATFELINKQKLYTDWRKIGGLSYFFGAWTTMIGHGYVKKDKVLHFIAGWSIGTLSYVVTKKIGVSIGIAAAAGILKEVGYDWLMKKGTPSVKDALWTGAGGFYGSITIPMFKTKPCKPILL